MRVFFAAILFAAAYATTACNGIVDPSKNVTETKTGSIPVQGTTIPGIPWSTSKTGEYSVKIVSMDPNNGVYFGAMLTYAASDGSCSGSLTPLQQNSFGSIGTPVMSGAIYPGTYCVFLFDVGSFATAENFVMQISHP